MRSEGKPNLQVARSVDVSDDAAAALVAVGATLTRTQTPYCTAVAVQKPRERKAIQAAVLEEAELAGDDFFYSWSTNNKDGSRGLVEGLSIEGAMILYRNWGNCALPTEIVQDTPLHWIISATFVDLETGANIQRLFRQRKNQTAGGKMDADRMMDIAFQIGQSKAQRNAVDKAMPNWLKNAALEKAKSASEGKFRDVPAATAKAVGAFSNTYSITLQQLEEKLGLKSEHWTARDLVSLSGLFRALRDRQTSVDQEFPREPAAPQAPEEPKPQAEPPADDGFGGGPTQGPTQPVPPATQPQPAAAKPAQEAQPVAQPEPAKPAAPAAEEAAAGPAGAISAAEAAEIAAAERAEAEERKAPPVARKRAREPGDD